MKNLTLIFYITLLVGAITTQSAAQDRQVDEVLYEAYLTKNMNLWEKGVSMSTEDYEQNPGDASLMNLSLTQYGLLNATIIDKDEDLFDKYEDDTIDNIEKLIKKDKKQGEPKAILSSIYGLKMAYSPWKGIFLGSKSNNLISEATRLSKKSAIVWKLYGNSKLYTPENFGGDKVEAAEAFEKAIELYENSPESIKNNWIYLDALAHLGITYMKLDKPDKARGAFEKALKAEPNFYWVKDVLLPQLDKS